MSVEGDGVDFLAVIRARPVAWAIFGHGCVPALEAQDYVLHKSVRSESIHGFNDQAGAFLRVDLALNLTCGGVD